MVCDVSVDLIVVSIKKSIASVVIYNLIVAIAGGFDTVPFCCNCARCGGAPVGLLVLVHTHHVYVH